eukprot:3933400-Rhodomonas_salina.2
MARSLHSSASVPELLSAFAITSIAFLLFSEKSAPPPATATAQYCARLSTARLGTRLVCYSTLAVAVCTWRCRYHQEGSSSAVA